MRGNKISFLFFSTSFYIERREKKGGENFILTGEISENDFHERFSGTVHRDIGSTTTAVGVGEKIDPQDKTSFSSSPQSSELKRLCVFELDTFLRSLLRFQ